MILINELFLKILGTLFNIQRHFYRSQWLFVVMANFYFQLSPRLFTIGRLNFLCLGRFFKIDAHFFKDQKSLSKISGHFFRSRPFFKIKVELFSRSRLWISWPKNVLENPLISTLKMSPWPQNPLAPFIQANLKTQKDLIDP